MKAISEEIGRCVLAVLIMLIWFASGGGDIWYRFVLQQLAKDTPNPVRLALCRWFWAFR